MGKAESSHSDHPSQPSEMVEKSGRRQASCDPKVGHTRTSIPTENYEDVGPILADEWDTSMRHKPVAQRSKRRLSGLWLRGTQSVI